MIAFEIGGFESARRSRDHHVEDFIGLHAAIDVVAQKDEDRGDVHFRLGGILFDHVEQASQQVSAFFQCRKLARRRRSLAALQLLKSLLDGLRDHLNPGGRALLAYGAVDGIQHLLRYSEDNGLRVRILDDRKLEDLPAVFVPGMLLEVSL